LILSFSFDKTAGNGWFCKVKSDLGIALDDGADDGMYLDALEKGGRTSLRQARADVVIFLAGADPYADDCFSVYVFHFLRNFATYLFYAQFVAKSLILLNNLR
jgi:acetoin utilization deacetylase AcuC-like enzyme